MHNFRHTERRTVIIKTDRQTERYIVKQIDGQSDSQAVDSQTIEDRRKVRWTSRQTDRQMEKITKFEIFFHQTVITCVTIGSIFSHV
jgi:hypothetical protein